MARSGDAPAARRPPTPAPATNDRIDNPANTSAIHTKVHRRAHAGRSAWTQRNHSHHILLLHRLKLSGDIVVPPLFASTGLFGLGIVAVSALGASPLHLLGWFPLSVVLGVVVLMFPAGVTFTLACLGLIWHLKVSQGKKY